LRPSGGNATALWNHDCMAWKDKAKAMVKGGNPATAVSGPQVWRLGHGDEIALEVNRKYLSTEVANDLMGAGPMTDYAESVVDILMFRDETSEYEDSVRLELPDGRLIGWISKADSETACQLIEHIAQARDRRERRLPIRLMVSLACEAFWPNYEDGDDPTNPAVRGVDFDLFEVQIQNPIQAEML